MVRRSLSSGICGCGGVTGWSAAAMACARGRSRRRRAGDSVGGCFDARSSPLLRRSSSSGRGRRVSGLTRRSQRPAAALRASPASRTTPASMASPASTRGAPPMPTAPRAPTARRVPMARRARLEMSRRFKWVRSCHAASLCATGRCSGLSSQECFALAARTRAPRRSRRSRRTILEWASPRATRRAFGGCGGVAISLERIIQQRGCAPLPRSRPLPKTRGRVFGPSLALVGDLRLWGGYGVVGGSDGLRSWALTAT